MVWEFAACLPYLAVPFTTMHDDSPLYSVVSLPHMHDNADGVPIPRGTCTCFTTCTETSYKGISKTLLFACSYSSNSIYTKIVFTCTQV